MTSRLRKLVVQHFFLLIALLSLGTAVLLDKGYMLVHSGQPFVGFDIEEVQQNYAFKEGMLLRAMRQTETLSASANEKNFFEQIDHNELTDNGLFLLAYRNDSLCYWSDSSVPVSHSFSKSKLHKRIVNLSNGFYTIYTKEYENYTIVGLILIRHQYGKKNKFLKEEFQKDFPLDDYIIVSELELTEDTRVLDFKDEYLFTLVAGSIKHSAKPFYFASISAYFLVYIFLIIYLNSIINRLHAYKPTNLWLFPFIVIWLLIRWWMIAEKDPSALYLLSLFDPTVYSQSYWAPSLGDLLINNILYFYIAFKFHKFTNTDVLLVYLKGKEKKTKYFSYLQPLAVFFILGFFWFFSFRIAELLEGLVLHSSISFEVYQILEVSENTVLGYLIAGIGLATLLVLMDKFARILISLMPWWGNVIVLLVSAVLVAFFVGAWSAPEIIQVALLTVLLAILVFSQHWHNKYPFYVYTLVIFISSIFTVAVVSQAMHQKDKEMRLSMARDMIEEHDVIAEVLLGNIEKKLQNDQFAKEYMFGSPYGTYKDPKNLYTHIKKKHFGGYLSKYEFSLNTCSPHDTLLQSAAGDEQHCYEKYLNLIDLYGSPLSPSNFYYLDKQNGKMNYLGWIRYPSPVVGGHEVSLFIELTSQTQTQQLGYPELLLDGDILSRPNHNSYHYAKYKNRRLISKQGDYPYKLNLEYATQDTVPVFVEANGFSHLVYHTNKETGLVLSKKQTTWLDFVVFFAYIFASYYILLLLTLLLTRIRTHLSQPKLFFKSRIQVSMIGMLSMSLLLIGGGTVYLNLNQFERQHFNTIREKMQSVVNELENHLGTEPEVNSNWHTGKFMNLNELLSQLANVFYSDINMYDLEGNLLATSRSEVFDTGLQGTKIHPTVYQELIMNEKANFFHTEKIGNLEFLSAYAAFRNHENRELVYINIPYFSRQSEQKRELSTLVVALINIYVILILFAIFITVLISNKITEPLKLIQHSFAEMELGKRNTIVYSSDDEIGNLVKQYNNKVKELAESAEKLAANERDGAWREMAKQVAHEIKNPLTPMQLSLQLMLRSWRDEDPRFGNRIEKTASTLIEQINRLSNIATEFSNFAKMPEPKNKPFNLVNEVEKITQLFQSEDVVLNVELNDYEELWVFADEEQFARALTNLIKNGIQAIPKDKDGIIEVELFNDQEYVRIKVQDNGSGIPEDIKPKLFQPNFTTKSSGTGVGLYIVQSIIKAANGSIWFETEVDRGTEFFVKIPLTDARPTDQGLEV